MTWILLHSWPDSTTESWKEIEQGGEISKRQATDKRGHYYSQAGMCCPQKSVEGYSVTRCSYTENFQKECSDNVTIGTPALVMDVKSTVLHTILGEIKTLNKLNKI
jgi:hypothetical protein